MATVRKKIQRVPRSPRVSSGIRPVGANSTVNQEYLASGDHYPDRTLAPLILQPFSSYTDGTTGKHVENAMPEVTAGCWYRLDSSNRSLGLCEATKIQMSKTGVDSAGNPINVFSVVNTPGSADYGRLTIRENVPPDEEITYVFEGTLATDGSLIRKYFNCRCEALTEIPDILFDNNPTAIYNPLSDTQYFAINPSLSIDYPVTWKWQSYHELEGGWVDFGSTQLDWCIDKVGDGIRIDRKVMPDMVLLRCIAEATVGGTTVQLEKAVTHTRTMPHYEVDIIRIGELPEDMNAISPYAEIKVNGELLTDISELSVEWLNSSKAVIATGLNPTISLSSLNADQILDLQVRDRGGWVLLTDNGYLLTDDDGVLLRTRSKT